MRTLNRIKKEADVLKAKVMDAELVLQGSEHDYNEQPSMTNYQALEVARENYRKAYMLYESCLGYIQNYDFYRQCEKQEREEAESRRLAMAYC